MTLLWTTVKGAAWEKHHLSTWWGEMLVYEDHWTCFANVRSQSGSFDRNIKISNIQEGIRRCEDFYYRYHAHFTGAPHPDVQRILGAA
ncbi:MAG: hypothetical protein OQK00_09225 [Rhodobacteraceae bacterium]|nr:hypothetical protein [Paracoccaceae bacterium]MCW9041732.1 hypothetical protein [Pseudopelagicola sp.]